MKRKEVKAQSSYVMGIEKIVLERRQLALKICANSVYGLYGTCNSSCLQFIEGAESTTAMGRSMLMKASNNISWNYLVNIIYGDMDSCFVYILYYPEHIKRSSKGVSCSSET